MAKTYFLAAAGALAAMLMPAVASAHGYGSDGGYGRQGYHRHHDGYGRDWRHDRWERRRWAEARRHAERERWERRHWRQHHRDHAWR